MIKILVDKIKKFTHDDSKSKYYILVITSLGVLLLNIDLFIVNVAIPAISTNLHAPLNIVTWTISAYALMIGIFPAVMGKISDIWGQKKVYIIGIFIFTISSLACGLSPTITLLIIFRIVQGIGAAIMLPGTMSILVQAFPKEQRGLAIGLNGGIGGVGLVSGPVLGGLLVHGNNWRWIFFINVPIGILTIVLTVLFLSEKRGINVSRKIDWGGIVSLPFGLFAILFAFTIAERSGFNEKSILCLLIGLVALVIFIIIERTTKEPFIQLSLFKNTAFVMPCISLFLFSAALFGSQSYWSMFLQRYWGFSSLKGGLAFLPATILIAILTPFAGIISQKSGTKLRYIVLSGAILIAISFLYISDINTKSNYINSFLPSLMIRGIGIPLLMSSTSLMIMNSVSNDKAGLASGMLNMSKNVGTALGVAILGQIFNYNTNKVVSTLGNNLPKDILLKTKNLAVQFTVISDKSAISIAQSAIVDSFGKIALYCAIALIPVLFCAFFIKEKKME